MKIIITCSHFDREANEKVDYRNTVEVDDALVVDFRKFYEVMKDLYPRSTFITFNIPTSSAGCEDKIGIVK